MYQSLTGQRLTDGEGLHNDTLPTCAGGLDIEYEVTGPIQHLIGQLDGKFKANHQGEVSGATRLRISGNLALVIRQQQPIALTTEAFQTHSVNNRYHAA